MEPAGGGQQPVSVWLLGFRPDKVQDAVPGLIQVFGVDRAAAVDIVNDLPKMVRTKATPVEAAKYMAALASIGARAEVRPHAAGKGRRKPAPLSMHPPIAQPIELPPGDVFDVYLAGFEPAALPHAVTNLMRLFGIDEAEAQDLAASAPVIVKQRANADKAREYARTLQDVGAIVTCKAVPLGKGKASPGRLTNAPPRRAAHATESPWVHDEPAKDVRPIGVAVYFLGLALYLYAVRLVQLSGSLEGAAILLFVGPPLALAGIGIAGGHTVGAYLYYLATTLGVVDAALARTPEKTAVMGFATVIGLYLLAAVHRHLRRGTVDAVTSDGFKFLMGIGLVAGVGAGLSLMGGAALAKKSPCDPLNGIWISEGLASDVPEPTLAIDGATASLSVQATQIATCTCSLREREITLECDLVNGEKKQGSLQVAADGSSLSSKTGVHYVRAPDDYEPDLPDAPSSAEDIQACREQCEFVNDPSDCFSECGCPSTGGCAAEFTCLSDCRLSKTGAKWKCLEECK